MELRPTQITVGMREVKIKRKHWREGAVVTIDAMGCQRSIARQIIDKKADYILALKGNQGTLREDVGMFAAASIMIRGPVHKLVPPYHMMLDALT